MKIIWYLLSGVRYAFNNSFSHLNNFELKKLQKHAISDVLFILNNTIVEYRDKKQDLYILFGDLEKCFDKLYLKDCIIELTEAGMPVQEAVYIYEIPRI